MDKPEYNFYPLDQQGISTKSGEPQPNTPSGPVSESNIVPGPNGSVLNNGIFQSPNFITGANGSGWRINSNGDVEFNNGNFRGDITGASGTFSGALAASTIDIGGADSSSFHVDIDGNMWLGAAAYNDGPFRVSSAGVLVSTSSTVNGSILDGSVFYGSGSDGDVTISGNTTLTRNMYYLNLTVDQGFTLNPGGYQIFVKETLTLNGSIARAGNNGSTGSNGTASGGSPGVGGGAGGAAATVLAGGTVSGAVVGINGGSGGGQGSAGDTTQTGTAVADSAGSDGVQGGTGGAGQGAGGGTQAVATATAAVSGTQNIAEAVILRNSLSATFNQIKSSASPNSGAGGGGGRGTNSNPGGGGGGGGSAGPGPVVAVYARTIIISATGVISCIGGVGGNGGNAYALETGAGTGGGGGGGGGGGNGGLMILVYRSLTNNGSISVAAGAGGTGGTGTNGGGSGANGTSGTVGTLISLQE